MNKRIIVSILAITLLIMTSTAIPVLAKTKTEVYVRQMGGTSWTNAESLDTPNGRMHFRWGGEGAGTLTLFEGDKTTVIDTFTCSSEVDVKGKDSTSLGFANGVLVAHLKMLWISNTHTESGFEGVAQWRATDEIPHVVTIKAVYQGFGYYQGQLLQLEGVFALPNAPLPGQTLTGTLLA